MFTADWGHRHSFPGLSPLAVLCHTPAPEWNGRSHHEAKYYDSGGVGPLAGLRRRMGRVHDARQHLPAGGGAVGQCLSSFLLIFMILLYVFDLGYHRVMSAIREP